MTKHEKYAEMYEIYKSGKSLSEVGHLYSMTRQSVYEGFRRRSYQLRSKAEAPYQTLDGIKFTLRNHGYYAATTGDRELMHRYVWRKYRGDIPENHDIHHVDHNRANNDVTNLELYSKSDHARLFSTGSNQFVKRPFKESVVNE